MKSQHLIDYYSQRVEEYDRIYAKPERQDDLATLQNWVGRELDGQTVLEIACGTDYWTTHIVKVANSVTAIDESVEVLEYAKQRCLHEQRVRFEQADAFRLNTVEGTFSAVFAAFWWSHVPIQELASFLQHLHSRVGSKTRIVFIDNIYVEGSNTPICSTDDEGNTYQKRKLDDGCEHRILKNFPSEAELT